MADATPAWERVKPEGLAEAILVVTICLTIICIVIFGLRMYIRLKTRVVGMEDYLMCIGMVRIFSRAVVLYL